VVDIDTNLPVLIKGLLRADDAVRAVDAGAAARSCRTTAAASSTPRRRRSTGSDCKVVGGRTESIVDGGIRRARRPGHRAGARRPIGRPIVWG
jgi:isopentenyl diphosphate isomerase/L-lactate dehydrogenase-like FMN-dependent dehydrogenase